MTTTVSNCPFCGSANIEIDEVDNGEVVMLGEYFVECTECRCCGPIGGDIMEAIRDWNRAWEKDA
jgi:Lar family restriction alleviation protein